MEESLRWVGAIGLPFMSLVFGFALGIALISDKGDREGLRLAGFSLVVIFMAGIQLIAKPVIEPIWLQYLILSVVPIVAGAAIVVRPQWPRKGTR